MARKLFAMEDVDLEGDVVELEAAPEVGEVADAQVETEAAADEVAEVESGIEEGIGAADQMEQIEEVVASAAEGEGLDPVAAEAVKVAIEAICSRVGANPKSIYSLYATENFQSASSRKANTKIALEGVGEFLQNLWEKIKAALTSLWEKAKDLWNKYFSSLNRTLKALESMKDKVSRAKGIPSYELTDAPSSLKSIFPVKSATISKDEIETYKNTLQTAKSNLDDFRLLEQKSSEVDLAKINEIVQSALGNNGKEITLGSEDNPLPNGVYYKWTYKFNEETDNEVTIRTLEVDEDHGKYADGRKEVQVDIANKDALKTLITDTIAIIKEKIKERDKFQQRAKKINDAMKRIDTQIKNIKDPNNQKSAKANMRAFNLLMSKGPGMDAKLLSANLAYAKGVLIYSAVCLKNYKG